MFTSISLKTPLSLWSYYTIISEVFRCFCLQAETGLHTTGRSQFVGKVYRFKAASIFIFFSIMAQSDLTTDCAIRYTIWYLHPSKFFLIYLLDYATSFACFFACSCARLSSMISVRFSFVSFIQTRVAIKPMATTPAKMVKNTL